MLSRIEDGARLVTLTGPGGTGKTRLALEAASTLVPEYKAGVFWVGLASLRDPALVTETIAQTLGAKDGLAEHIAEREMLLLLDNLEQVIEAAPELSRAPRCLPQPDPPRHLAASSCASQGEVEYPVPPLAEPEAVSLFCERAQLEPSEEIAELCARLDSLPLAVELAAARTKALSPAQILERLSQRLDLLKGGRDADPRQQTLERRSSGATTSSHPRSSSSSPACPSSRRLHARGGRRGRDADLDTLQSLVEKSLLRFTEGALLDARDDPRVRGGATRRSRARQMRSQERHAERFLRLARRRSRSPAGSAGRGWLERLDAEHGNLRAALAWGRRAGRDRGRVRGWRARWMVLAAGAAISRRAGVARARAERRRGYPTRPARELLTAVQALVADDLARRGCGHEETRLSRALGLTGARPRHRRPREHVDELAYLGIAAGDYDERVLQCRELEESASCAREPVR